MEDSAPVVSIPGVFEGWPGPIELVKEIKQRQDLKFLECVDSLSFFKKP